MGSPTRRIGWRRILFYHSKVVHGISRKGARTSFVTTRRVLGTRAISMAEDGLDFAMSSDRRNTKLDTHGNIEEFLSLL